MSRRDLEKREAPEALRRDLGVLGATFLGLGSILGAGVFVTLGLAVDLAGPAVVLAILGAALVATCNALSSAQLAANHPTSGGTYEYGYVYLRPWLGFCAGWMFLCAKSASAATAALGFAGYCLVALGVPDSSARTPLALVVVIAVVLVVLGGIRRSNVTNTVIVSITLATLGYFLLAGSGAALANGREHLEPFFSSPSGDQRSTIARLLEATALVFVAYTGYGRVATLGEEVRSPRRTIPRAILLTLVVSMFLYLGVGLVGVAAVGADDFVGAESPRAGVERAAPLAVVARAFDAPGGAWILSLGAITAMLGVLLNLVLGLSRVALAMARRGDLPRALARVDGEEKSPRPAVLAAGALILALVGLGSVELAWTFSAFTVLIYYALTNLAAIRLPGEARLYPSILSWLGLVGCLSLAFWVEPRVWLAGLALLAAGLGARAVFAHPSPDGARSDSLRGS